jgi:hypothetical protein
MADASVGQSAVTGTFGSPALAVRRDRMLTDAPLNNEIARLQVDSKGLLRTTSEGGRTTYRATFGTTTAFVADTTGTDIAYIQGAGAIDVQTINTGSQTAGVFTLSFVVLGSNPILAVNTSLQTTANIPWNATADQVRKALEALPAIGVGSVVVTGGPLPATAVTIKFIGPLAGYQLPMVLTANTTGTCSTLTHTTAGWANQHTLTSSGTWTAGTFTLTFTLSQPGLLPVTVTTAPITVTLATTAVIVAAINTAMLAIPGNATGAGFCVLTTPNGGGTNGPISTNNQPVVFSFGGSINGQTLNSDMVTMGYDIALITGGGGLTIANVNARVIKIRRIELSTIATTAVGGVFTVKRTAAIPSGGTAVKGQGVTATLLTFTANDPYELPSVATCAYYTGHPTIATAVSYLISQQITQQLAATAPVSSYVWDFNNSIGERIPALRGIADVFVFTAVAALCASGSAWNLEIEYTEEPFTA